MAINRGSPDATYRKIKAFAIFNNPDVDPREVKIKINETRDKVKYGLRNDIPKHVEEGEELLEELADELNLEYDGLHDIILGHYYDE